MINALLDSDDDWIERLRGWLYPKLKPIWPSATIEIDDTGLVTTIPVDVEVLEVELDTLDFERNPVAGYKQHVDGRESIGSWVLLPENDPTGTLDPHEQLHITLMCGGGGVDVFAHIETDWRDDPIGHLTDGGSYSRANSLLAELFADYSYLNHT